METKRIQQLAIMALAHRVASDELKFENIRSKLGQFASQYSLELKDVEQFIGEFLILMRVRYVEGKLWDDRKSEKFGTIGLLLFLHMCATEGIKFNGIARKLGQFRQTFKIDKDECNEFMKEILHLLHQKYVQAPSKAEVILWDDISE